VKRKHLLLATAIAGFAAVITSDHLAAQTAGPGYAASITGAASTTSTAADAIITFGGGWNTSYKTYVRSIQCGRTDAGTSAIKVTFNDTASTVLVLPNSGGGSWGDCDLPIPASGCCRYQPDHDHLHQHDDCLLQRSGLCGELT
jgi:hypothetical protein